MSSAPNAPKPAAAPIRVVIVGVGPAGCLAAHLMLLRGKQYTVTVVDARPDPTTITLGQQRSWMVGLSAHGLTAVDRVPGLRTALQDVGLRSRGVKIYLGKRSFMVGAESDAFVVDRNWVVAGMMRHLYATNPDTDRLQCLWKTKCLYVDPAARTVTVQQGSDAPMTLEYDVCLGCDGVRSVVRNALLQDRNFEFQLVDTFGLFKSVHVPRPADVDPSLVHLAMTSTPILGFVPEQDGFLNVAGGFKKNESRGPELFSTDPAVVEQYMSTKFSDIFQLDWKSFAEQWTSQNWNTTGQVKCNFYHHSPGRCLLLGDAAHATSPNVGQGMNAALADAACLSDLLDEYNDDWEKVLPAFTKLRVKEGHALVDMSAYFIAFDPTVQVLVTLWQGAQTMAGKVAGSVIPPWFTAAITNGAPLSTGYRLAVLSGPLEMVRRSNDNIRRVWTEEKIGLIPKSYRRPTALRLVLEPLWHIIAAGAALLWALALLAALPLRLAQHCWERSSASDAANECEEGLV